MPFNPNKQIPGGPETVNEAFLDALVRHQIYLTRLSGSIRNQIFDVLNATERDIADKVRTRMRTIKGGATPANLARLKSLQKSIAGVRNKAWDKVDRIYKAELTALALAEPGFVNDAFKATSLVLADTLIPPKTLLKSIVSQKPFQGKVLAAWSSDLRKSDIDRLSRGVAIGMAQGEHPTVIARRLVGTAKFKGMDGLTEITRRHANSLARTAVISVSNEAKRMFYQQNEKLFKLELFIATLDGRTSARCRSLDGKKFKVGIGPMPALHFNCRSTRVGVIDGHSLSNRPTVAATNKMLLRDFTRKNGLRKTSSRANLPRGYKGQFDRFKRRRIRELTGSTPGKTTYGDFLKRQSVEFQNDVLGVTKARLFRKGDLSLDRFVNRRGDELTLSQLAKTETQAFKNAGLDPEEFL